MEAVLYRNSVDLDKFPESSFLTQNLQRQLFIDYQYNFQMNPSKQHFLFLLLLTFIVRSQVLNPIGNCLGNCINCAANDLSACKGGLSCEWGYYISSPNGTCTLAPSKEVVWSQLGQRTLKNEPPVSESWGASTKQIACEYNSPSGKKHIDALGLFNGVTMLEKTFPVNSNSQLFVLSFNLLRDEWMPFNDFLLIDISSNDQTIQSIEISYEQRVKVESQQTVIQCGNKRVISQKFNVRIQNNNDIGNSLTIIFTSFLYISQWGLTNIKLLSACTHFSTYDPNTEACTICDTDSYTLTLYGGQKVCDKCPPLCKTCSSKTNCTHCLDGATMDKNRTCNFASNLKTQQIVSSIQSLSTCSNYSFYISNLARKVIFNDISNDHNFLYDQIQLNFKLFYNPKDWTATNNDKISIKINKVQVFVLSYRNFTNKGTISCKSFKSNHISVLQILTPKKIHNDHSLSLEVEYIGKLKEAQFAISEVIVSSIKKELVVVPAEIPKPAKAGQKSSNISVISNQANNQTNSSLDFNKSNMNSETDLVQVNKTVSNLNGPLDSRQPSNHSNSTNNTYLNSSIISNSAANNTNILTIKEQPSLKDNSNHSISQNTTNISIPISSVSQVALEKKNENSSISQNPIPTNKSQKEPLPQTKLNDSIDIDETKKQDTNPLKQEVVKSIDSNNSISYDNDAIAKKQIVLPINESTNSVENIKAPQIQVQIVHPPLKLETNKNQQNKTISIPEITENTSELNHSKPKVTILDSKTVNSSQQSHADISPNQKPPLSSSVAYIPTSDSDHSGLHVVISHVPSVSNSNLQISIDKLDPKEYQLSDTYFQDSDLHVFIAIRSSFINGKMTVYKVTPSRLLQSASKNESQVIAVVSIDRYDALSSSQLFSINAFSIIFQVFAWIGVISIMLAIFSGYGVVVEQFIMSLQLLFLHVYIAADYLPLTFRDVIGGLNIIQNLNFFAPSHGESIEKTWLGNVIQNGPIRFFLFNTDINFTREFYPIIIVNIFYAVWFIGLYITKRFLLRKDLIDEEKPALYRILDNIICRPINYIDQIWRYQFLATVWCCFIQFYNMTYPEGSNRSEIINALLCVMAFVCTLGWPVFLGYYCRKYYYQNQYSDYLYRFEDVYYHRIPEYFLPSNHHRVGFPIVRSAKLFLAAVIIAYFGNIASLTLLILIGLNLFEAGYAKYHEIFVDNKYFAHRLVENTIFALMQLILFFLCSFSSLAFTESYVYIGFVLSGMALLIVVNSLARVAHLASEKYRQMFEEMNWEPDQLQKPKTQRVV